jgi:hypothetical protein
MDVLVVEVALAEGDFKDDLEELDLLAYGKGE